MPEGHTVAPPFSRAADKLIAGDLDMRVRCADDLEAAPVAAAADAMATESDHPSVWYGYMLRVGIPPRLNSSSRFLHTAQIGRKLRP